MTYNDVSLEELASGIDRVHKLVEERDATIEKLAAEIATLKSRKKELILEKDREWIRATKAVQDLFYVHSQIRILEAGSHDWFARYEERGVEIATLKSERDEARDLLSGYETIARLNAKIADGAQWPEEAVVRATFEDGQEVEIWDLSPEFLAKLNG